MIHAALAFVLLAGLPADTTLVPGNQEAINVTASRRPTSRRDGASRRDAGPMVWLLRPGPDIGIRGDTITGRIPTATIHGATITTTTTMGRTPDTIIRTRTVPTIVAHARLSTVSSAPSRLL